MSCWYLTKAPVFSHTQVHFRKHAQFICNLEIILFAKDILENCSIHKFVNDLAYSSQNTKHFAPFPTLSCAILYLFPLHQKVSEEIAVHRKLLDKDHWLAMSDAANQLHHMTGGLALGNILCLLNMGVEYLFLSRCGRCYVGRKVQQ